MHPDFARADKGSPHVLGAAIKVHRDKRAGLLEGIYKRCLPPLRVDFSIDRCWSVEAEAVEKLLRLPVARLLSYIKLSEAPLGLLLHFHEAVVKGGIRRLTLRGADQP